ncbi:MAG: hypothetical protein DME16_09240, partial [Candidatus Rokuibacteriota bacterium]
MRIAIGCDDTGFPLKEHVTSALEAAGHDLLDLGTFSKDPVDYPDYARAVGQAVLRGFVDAGILMCGSGASASIAANKLRGIRGALCHDAQAARLSREEDDANILCLGAREVEPARAVEITIAWVTASFKSDERFVRKVSKVALLEASSGVVDKPPARPAIPLHQDATTAPIAAREALAEPPDAIAQAYEESAVEASLEVEDAAGVTEIAAPAAPLSPARPVDEVFKLPAVQETMDLLERQDFLDRLWVKDATLWKGETTA